MTVTTRQPEADRAIPAGGTRTRRAAWHGARQGNPMSPCWAAGRRSAGPRPVATPRPPVASRLRRASGRGMQPLQPPRRRASRRDPRPVPLHRRAHAPSPMALKWHRTRRSPWPASSPTSTRDNGASAPPACRTGRRPTTAEVTKAREWILCDRIYCRDVAAHYFLDDL